MVILKVISSLILWVYACHTYNLFRDKVSVKAIIAM